MGTVFKGERSKLAFGDVGIRIESRGEASLDEEAGDGIMSSGNLTTSIRAALLTPDCNGSEGEVCGVWRGTKRLSNDLLPATTFFTTDGMRVLCQKRFSLLLNPVSGSVFSLPLSDFESSCPCRSSLNALTCPHDDTEDDILAVSFFSSWKPWMSELRDSREGCCLMLHGRGLKDFRSQRVGSSIGLLRIEEDFAILVARSAGPALSQTGAYIDVERACLSCESQ